MKVKFLSKITFKHSSVTDSVASIFSSGFWEKYEPGSGNFPPGCPFPSGRCFAFFKHTQMIHAGYVKVAPGKPQPDRVNLKISSRYWGS